MRLLTSYSFNFRESGAELQTPSTQSEMVRGTARSVDISASFHASCEVIVINSLGIYKHNLLPKVKPMVFVFGAHLTPTSDLPFVIQPIE